MIFNLNISRKKLTILWLCSCFFTTFYLQNQPKISNSKKDSLKFSDEDKKYFEDLKLALFDYSGTAATRYTRLYQQNKTGFELFKKMSDFLPTIKGKKDSDLYKYAKRLYMLFWQTGRMKEASQIGRYLDKSDVSNQTKMINALSTAAFFCYEWSEDATNTEDKDLCDAIGLSMSQDIHILRDDSKTLIPSDLIKIIYDKYGIARAFVSFYVSDDPSVNPKIYIVFTGTRNNVPWRQVLKQWIFTNFNFFPRKHNDGWYTHRGFQDMSDGLEAKIIDCAKEKFPNLENEKFEVVIKGHSLGAAIANIIALNIGNKNWCKLCLVTTMATPYAFIGKVKIPKNTLIQNYLHSWDIVAITRLLFHGIGDTYILNDSDYLKLPSRIHSTFYPLFFHLFNFRSGENTIVKTITYNHEGDLVKDFE